MNFLKKIFTLLFLFFFFTTNTFAAELSCPNYVFERDLKQGSVGDDVRLLQKILNLDYRTRIADIGKVGGPGSETNTLGVGTREALKRFQALFIEVIGVADGKFNDKTRVVMNSVCKGPYFTGGSGGVYDLEAATTTASTTEKDTISPIVLLYGPSQINPAGTFRITLVSNEAIKQPILNSLYTLTGKVSFSDMRKVNQNSYTILVTVLDKKSSSTIRIQLEADAIQDLAGNKNESSSNILEIKSVPDYVPVATATVTTPTIPLPGVPDLNLGNGTGGNGNGSSEGDGDSGGGGGGGFSMEQLMELLKMGQQLLGGLGGLGGAGKDPAAGYGTGSDYGGITTGVGKCACGFKTPGTDPGVPIYHVVANMGPTGGYKSLSKPLIGCTLGKYVAYKGICGQKEVYENKKWRCLNPQNDDKGWPVVAAATQVSGGAGGSCSK